jgi:hypothetical protein
VQVAQSVLLVASDPRWRQTYRGVFAAAGWRVYSVLDAFAAVQLLKSEDGAIDAVLVVSPDVDPSASVAILSALTLLPIAQRQVPAALHVLTANDEAALARWRLSQSDSVPIDMGSGEDRDEPD